MALERQPAATGAEVIKYSSQRTVALAPPTLVGQGIAGAAAVATSVADGEIVWKLIRQETDDLGMTHSFYRQVLVPAAALAAGLEPAALRDGLELAGSEVGIHLRADGTLRAMFGTQYRDAVVAVLPAITTAAQAFAVGLPALASREGLVVRDYPAWVARMTASGRASLLLASAGDGRTFRPTWQLEVSDDDGIPYVAALDAVTGEVVSVVRAVLDWTCNPSTTIQASAAGEPQNQAIPNRSIKATLANDRLPTFTHEASWPGDGVTYPDIQVFFSIKENDPGFSTYMCPSKWHGILPVKTVSGTVTYDNWTEEAFLPGRAAADAIKFTRDTMYVLKSKLGRFSWDGSGGEAKVVLNSWVCGGPDFPCFMVPETAWNPPNSVNLGPNGSRPYLYSSCLDMVAHEWGHGVILTSANFSRNPNVNPDGTQLHEGFADFIGHATEWYRQPAGSGAERAEWQMGEDNGAAARWVDTDDNVGGVSFHADDPAAANMEPHGTGNRIGVAFRLLDIGGQNDVCRRLPALSGCSTTVNGLGLTKSSKIFFRVLTSYANSTTRWNDLADLATVAAFDLYKKCSVGYAAHAEQLAAYNSFKAIGHAPYPILVEECE